MPSCRVANHLRELVSVARELEAEAETPTARRAMKKLMTEYQALALRVEEIEADRRELITQIERCRVVAGATENVVCKAILANVIQYLEGKLLATTEPPPIAHGQTGSSGASRSR